MLNTTVKEFLRPYLGEREVSTDPDEAKEQALQRERAVGAKVKQWNDGCDLAHLPFDTLFEASGENVTLYHIPEELLQSRVDEWNALVALKHIGTNKTSVDLSAGSAAHSAAEARLTSLVQSKTKCVMTLITRALPRQRRPG